jgi:hypothetical protein
MKFAKRLRGYHRFAKIEALTDRGVQNPGGCKDSYTRIALEPNILAITAIEGPENLHIRATIGVPSIMNPINLPDMGRMNGNWESEGKTGSSRAQIPARKPSRAR